MTFVKSPKLKGLKLGYQMKRSIMLILFVLLTAMFCTGCTKASPVFEQLKTENGMAALIDEVQSGRAQYLGYQEVTIKGSPDIRDMLNYFFRAESYVKAQEQVKPCLPDDKLKDISTKLEEYKMILPVPNLKKSTQYELTPVDTLEIGTYSRFDFASKIDDARIVYFTFFISNDAIIRAYGYAVTSQNVLGTIILNEYNYLIESLPPSPSK